MTGISVLSYQRNAEDSRGKEQPIVYLCVIDGREKLLSKSDLLRAIELTLPERSPAEQPDRPTPLFNGLTAPVERNDVV